VTSPDNLEFKLQLLFGLDSSCEYVGQSSISVFHLNSHYCLTVALNVVITDYCHLQEITNRPDIALRDCDN
jgi:hypothetical protein